MSARNDPRPLGAVFALALLLPLACLAGAPLDGGGQGSQCAEPAWVKRPADIGAQATGYSRWVTPQLALLEAAARARLELAKQNETKSRAGTSIVADEAAGTSTSQDSKHGLTQYSLRDTQIAAWWRSCKTHETYVAIRYVAAKPGRSTGGRIKQLEQAFGGKDASASSEPAWVSQLPSEPGTVFGLGIGASQQEAEELSWVDLSLAISSEIRSRTHGFSQDQGERTLRYYETTTRLEGICPRDCQTLEHGAVGHWAQGSGWHYVLTAAATGGAERAAACARELAQSSSAVEQRIFADVRNAERVVRSDPAAAKAHLESAVEGFGRLGRTTELIYYDLEEEMNTDYRTDGDFVRLTNESASLRCRLGQTALGASTDLLDLEGQAKTLCDRGLCDPLQIEDVETGKTVNLLQLREAVEKLE